MVLTRRQQQIEDGIQQQAQQQQQQQAAGAQPPLQAPPNPLRGAPRGRRGGRGLRGQRGRGGAPANARPTNPRGRGGRGGRGGAGRGRAEPPAIDPNQLEGGGPAPDEDENLGANDEAGGGDQQLQVPPTAQAPPGIEPAILDLFDASNGVMDQLLAIVEQYRKSEISKIDASLAISEAIPVADRTSDEFKGAFRTFMAQIEEVDHLRDQAAGRAIVGDTIAAGPQPAQGGRTTKAQDDIVNTVAATDPELAGDPDMLWNTPAEIPINRKISESLALSIRILRVTRKDPKFFLNMVLGKENLPPLPRDEWFKIVKGEAVNYNDVFKQLDTDFITEQRQFDLGNNLTLKVQDEHNLAERKSKGKGIATVGEWTRVHDLVSRATVMLFKHRKDELWSYGESIQSLFYSQTRSDVVLHYDRAVRNRYARENAFDLDDTSAYFSTWVSYFSASGAGHSEITRSGAGGSSSKGGGSHIDVSHQICNNWNENKCRRAETACRRRHVCNVAGCGKPHKASDHAARS